MEFKAFFAALLLVSVSLEWTAAKSFKSMKDGLSMVVRSRRALQRQKRSLNHTMASMHIKSVVKSRFAKVKIEREMENSEDTAKEMTFSVRLPEPAFISEFTMVVDGLEFIGKVKKKELAQAEYEGARDRGNSAGLVTADVRETQTFNVAANVPARSIVTFTLVYQELLKRKLGKYEHSIFINPGQAVEDFSINVYITERTGITTLETRHPQGGNGARGKVDEGYNSEGQLIIDTSIRRSKDQALVKFKPSQTQQRRLLMLPEDDRKVTVIYDVTREELGGEIQTRDGYFVHFFAPKDLTALPKSVVFVIDTSGSMWGTKMTQTKTAFETVLREMSDADEFNIVTFSEAVSVWEKNKMVKVTQNSKSRAIGHVKGAVASGVTNFNKAVLDAANLLPNATRSDRRLSAIIVLTDGKPTSGVTNEMEIRKNIKESINGRISLFCLGFGNDLNHNFLKKLANDNDGIARKIYEDSDADLQLEGFFREVAAPLLLNIRIKYSGVNVVKVSKTKIDKYFGGSEVIVVGTMQENSTVDAQVTGLNQDGKVKYTVNSSEISDNFTHSQEDSGKFSNVIERIWAYFTIKGLEEKKVLAETATERKRYINRALRLALKYGFVTPLTSMVVVTREDEVTTTAATPTLSTSPWCWRHGVPIPVGIRRPIIWCPYVFDEITSTNSPRRLSFLSYTAARRPVQFYPPRPQYMAFGAPSAARSMGLSPRSFRAFYRPRPRPSPTDHAYRQTYAVSPYCGGNFSRPRNTITLPSSLADHHNGTVYCDWNIKLQKGSWIDLYLEEIKTSDTKVKITSKGQTVYEHNTGKGAFKFISVESNMLNIRMTIDTTTKRNETIRITYNEFAPNKDISLEASDKQNGSDSQPSFIECGMNVVTSDENSGFISSPNYPSRYPPKSQCSWNITNNDPENFKLALHLVDMDIETDAEEKCAYDKLTIRQEDQQDKIMCGQMIRSIDVSSSIVHVLFTSDDLMEGSGFKMRYDFEPR